MSSLRRGHANLLCIVPILTEVHPRRGHSIVSGHSLDDDHKNVKFRELWCVERGTPAIEFFAGTNIRVVIVKMAKSLRSKQERKNRAIRREQIYKPVEDARTERVTANIGPVGNVLVE